MKLTLTLPLFLASTFTIALGCDTLHQHDSTARQNSDDATINWREDEQGIFSHQTQLTFADRFIKAGESYFSPDDSKVIFQAVEKPPAGEAADEFYAMFVADVKREAASGTITGIDNIKRLSPKGSANTCGWFHPLDSNVVIFASTIVPPSESTPPGYQRASGRYKWMFPPEMRIVRCELDKADGTAASLEVIVGDGKAYHAEGSLSADGRHLLYCSLESGDGDLFVYDMKSKAKHRIGQAVGYDGGPFFSPDGKRICYRSDRRGDNHLQIFVADLAFNEQGEVIGIQREYQLTDNGHVNWCPFWTHDGRHLVYSTSELGHRNYEVFVIDADPGNLPGSNGTIKYGTRARQVTHAAKADVLPAFSNDGTTMIWTSQRGEDGESQLWAARFVMNLDAAITSPEPPLQPAAQREGNKAERSANNDVDLTMIRVDDPETGRIFYYNAIDRTLSEYSLSLHTLTEVNDAALKQRIIGIYESQRPAD